MVFHLNVVAFLMTLVMNKLANIVVATYLLVHPLSQNSTYSAGLLKCGYVHALACTLFYVIMHEIHVNHRNIVWHIPHPNIYAMSYCEG
jgi:hypothetical protein